jgi:hypothetical protein
MAMKITPLPLTGSGLTRDDQQSGQIGFAGACHRRQSPQRFSSSC